MPATINRRVSRDKDPLKHRRVRNEDGRTGTITDSHASHRTGDDPKTVGRVHWDDMEKPWSCERVEDLNALEVLDAPEIALPVFVRKVLFRGRKDQVAEYVAALGPLDIEAEAQGARRYVEFDPQPAAYRRWRVVYQGPALDAERVAATPDRAPGAERLCKEYRDMAYDHDEPSYGY